MLNEKRHHGGFTLVEMMVVIVIMAILATISFNVYYAVMNYVKRNETQHRMEKVKMAIQEYQDKFSTYPYPGKVQDDYDKATKEDGKPVKLEFQPAPFYKAIKDYGNFINTDIGKDDKGEDVIVDAWGYPLKLYLVVTRLSSKGTAASRNLVSASKLRFTIEYLSVGNDGQLGTPDDVTLVLEEKAN